ncbi:hypothetical protein PC128_g26045 [Phytophthora cactorum]|nr:hypothetical protein PC128_g26045 [Phytophthora cactorum]
MVVLITAFASAPCVTTSEGIALEPGLSNGASSDGSFFALECVVDDFLHLPNIAEAQPPEVSHHAVITAGR